MDIFTGIGGWPLGFRLAFGAAHELVVFCERDEFCQRVLRKHWPAVPIVDDVFKLKGGDYGAIDILSCSPLRQRRSDRRHASEYDVVACDLAVECARRAIYLPLSEK
jgi:site-specific DNA-cytosine methylase